MRVLAERGGRVHLALKYAGTAHVLALHAARPAAWPPHRRPPRVASSEDALAAAGPTDARKNRGTCVDPAGFADRGTAGVVDVDSETLHVVLLAV
jgi:hypothetical protein